jgi:hypothetical protein
VAHDVVCVAEGIIDSKVMLSRIRVYACTNEL